MNRILVPTLVVVASLLLGASAAQAAWVPPKRLTWYWQLTGNLRTNVNAAAYDIDGEDSSKSQVANLHTQGRKVIAYFSAGTFENWRGDAAAFPAEVKGRNVDGWPGEKWLDIRRLDVLKPIMTKRMQAFAAKGFDAVEPDNVDGYSNSTGFSLTGAQQIAYNRMLSSVAHANGLAVFLKNDVDQASALQSVFDGAINEECAQYSECGALNPFLAANKPVLQVEYSNVRQAWVTSANQAGRMIAFANLDLDGRRWIPGW